MRRLVTLLLVCLAMPLCMSAQTAQDFASRFMEDNLDDKNLECVTVGPKMLREIMKLAKEYDGQIVVYKIDTEKEPELSAAFGIRSIPTLLFIPKSGDPQVAQGAMPKASLKKAIDEFLLGKQ